MRVRQGLAYFPFPRFLTITIPKLWTYNKEAYKKV